MIIPSGLTKPQLWREQAGVSAGLSEAYKNSKDRGHVGHLAPDLYTFRPDRLEKGCLGSPLCSLILQTFHVPLPCGPAASCLNQAKLAEQFSGDYALGGKGEGRGRGRGGRVAASREGCLHHDQAKQHSTASSSSAKMQDLAVLCPYQQSVVNQQ